jgi:hypothetical protein
MGSELERTKELYGFHPLSLVDDFINSADERCCASTDALEEFLLTQLGKAGLSEEEVRKVFMILDHTYIQTSSSELGQGFRAIRQKF